LHSLPGTHDVLLVDAGEARDPRPLDLRSNTAYRLEVPLGGDREPGLYYVNLQAGELAGYLYLLLYRQGDARRLLAVAEGGVEDLYSTHMSLFLHDLKTNRGYREIGGRLARAG
jgi:hypothetical protein